MNGAATWSIGVAAALVVAASAPNVVEAADAVPPAALGDVRIAYDRELWSASGDSAEFRLVCRAEPCRGWIVTGSVGESCGEARPPGTAGGEDRRSETVAGEGGIAWRVRRRFHGCRNLHPPNLEACAEVGGKGHRLVAVIAGCRSTPKSGSERLLDDLLRATGPR